VKPGIASTRRREAGGNWRMAAVHHQPLPECCGEPTGGGSAAQAAAAHPNRAGRSTMGEPTGEGGAAQAAATHPICASAMLEEGRSGRRPPCVDEEGPPPPPRPMGHCPGNATGGGDGG
jgi:hypothetical protein